jgi:hypothetical protein
MARKNERFGYTKEEWDDMAHELGSYVFRLHKGRANGTVHAKLALSFAIPDLGSAGRPGVPGSAMLTALIKRARELGYAICTNGGRERAIYYATCYRDVEDAYEAMEVAAQRELADAAILLRTKFNAGFLPEGAPSYA